MIKCVEKLRSQINAFAANAQERLLIWLTTANDTQLVDAMLAAENNPRAAQVPDLFVRVFAPFGNSASYATAVTQELLEQYSTSWDALPESGRPSKFEPTPSTLHTTCAAFLAHHENVFEHLVLVLTPSEIEDDAEFAEWLAQAAVQAGPMPRLRFLVLMPRGEGEATAQRVVELAQGRARAEALELNMPAALETLSRQAGGLGSPGGRFRHLFVQLTNAVGVGELAQAERLAGSALAITQAQGWPSLEVAVHFALGGGALAAGRPQDALPRYQAALDSARAAVKAGAGEGTALELRAQLAVASAQLRSGDYVAAAATYEQAAPLATAQSDLRMQLECWRMASFCHESAGSPQSAWEHAQRALRVGHSMDTDTRATSTLPYLGEALERLSRENLSGLTPDQVVKRMEGLLGKEWRAM